MRPLHAVVVGAMLAVAALAAGCGGAIPSSNGGPVTVKTAESSDGTYLVDSRGQALYLFEKDEDGESYCDGACASVWPPLETSSAPRGTAGVDGSKLGTMKRDDGETQVTYDGHPLYYYAADASTPGRTKGQEADQFGAEWYLVGTRGKPVESNESEHSGNSGTTTGGGGY